MEKILTIYNSHYYRSVDVHQKKQTPPRVIDHYELEFYTTATNISVINNVRYQQEVNNILIARPGDIRYSINNFECYCVHFSCKNEQIKFALDKLPSVFKPQNHEHILSLFKNVVASFPNVLLEDELILQGRIIELLGNVAKQNTAIISNQYSSKYFTNLSDACVYMASNFDKNLALDDIAKVANLSPSFFHSLFKQSKGMTPYEYLLRLRISMAKNLLRNSSAPLSEVGSACGFESQSYFSYIFKRNTGVSPNIYRKNTQIII